MGKGAASSGSRKPTAAGPKAASAPKRRLGRRNTEEAVSRVIAEQFKGYSPYDIDGQVNEAGYTLRQQLLADKREQKGTDTKFGPSRIQELKRQFPSSKSSAGGVLSARSDLPVDPELDCACKNLFSTNTTKQSIGALRAWLGKAPKCNQRELTGLLRTTLQMRPSRSTSNHTAVVLDIMKYLVRWGLHTEFAKETQVAVEVFDAALVAQHAAMKANDLGCGKFCDLYADILPLVLPAEALEKALPCVQSGEWKGKGEAVSTLVRSGIIGNRLFSIGWHKCAGDAMLDHIKGVLRSYEGQPITAQNLVKMKSTCLEEAERMGVQSLFEGRKFIKVSYRGWQLDIICQSLPEWVDLEVASFVKGRTVGMGLPALAFEQPWGPAFPAEGAPVDAAVLKDMKSARLALNDFLKSMEVSSGDLLKELVQTKAPLYKAMDATFKVEQSFVESITGPPGEAFVFEKVLQVLPKGTAKTEVASVHAEIQHIMQGDLYKYCSRSAQGAVDSVASAVHGIRQGTPVPFKSLESSSPFMKKVADLLPNFCSFDQGNKTTFGVKAVVALLGHLEAKHQAKQKVGLSELDWVHLFPYALSREERVRAEKLTERVVGSSALLKSRSATGPEQQTKKVKCAAEDIAAALFA